MNIWIVEDDYYQAAWIEEVVSKHFPGAAIKIVRTELEFWKVVDGDADRPDVVILDVILPWTAPSRNMEPPPDEVKANGRSRAGIRCARKLAENPRTRHVPVILYTVLDRQDLEISDMMDLADRGIAPVYLSKQSDPAPLVKMIQRVQSGY